MDAACALASDDSGYWRTPGDPDVCERIARRTGGDIVPGTWTFTVVDTRTVRREDVDTTWVEYRAQAEVHIPRVSGPPLRERPDRVGWVRRISENTNTFASYSADMRKRVDMMWDGMHDCRLSVINQETGRATISGYTYAFLDPVTQEEHFVVAEDDIRMAYVVLCRYQVSVEEETHAAVSTIRLKGVTSPAQPPIHFSITISEAGAVQVEIYDVAGRRIRAYDPSRLGQGAHAFSWDGMDQRGNRVPAGLYWIQARLGDAARTKRLVLVR